MQAEVDRVVARASEAIRSTLGYDVTDSQFWRDSFNVLDRQIGELERLWGAAGSADAAREEA